MHPEDRLLAPRGQTACPCATTMSPAPALRQRLCSGLKGLALLVALLLAAAVFQVVYFPTFPQDALSLEELAVLSPSAVASPAVPRIIHQIWVADEDADLPLEALPVVWRTRRENCQRVNGDFEFRFWTGREVRELIATEFPELLPTYDGYEFPVQRADAGRYIILRHVGGVFMDLDTVRFMFLPRSG
jgi:hypothetical protein